MDLNQITLAVVDFDKALRFYQTLGLKLIVLSENRYARFEMPSGGATLSLHIADCVRPGGTVLYFECDDVDTQHAILCDYGITFESAPRDEPWGWREARFHDPSGNELCLFHAGANRRFPPWRLQNIPKRDPVLI